VNGLYESLETEIECLANCGQMLPYATDGSDCGLGRHLNVARALVTEIDACLAAIADVMAAAPPSTTRTSGRSSWSRLPRARTAAETWRCPGRLARPAWAEDLRDPHGKSSARP
jgi:hypothetical protein